MRATIKDIARETGLSVATISKYLNNKKITEENRILIEEVIERLNYIPSRTARTLRAKKTRTVAILISNLANYFWGPVISAVSQFFMQYDYTVITSAFVCDPKIEQSVVQDLISQHVDGVVLLPYDRYDQCYCTLQEAGIPVVILDQIPAHLEHYPVDVVLSDNVQGSRLLAEYLQSRGHTDICILGKAENSYTVEQRIRGFTEIFPESMNDFFLKTSPLRFAHSEKVINTGRKLLRNILHMENRPSAIFITNYLVALGSLVEASTSGVDIPEDLSVVVFDDDPLFRSMHTPITCVAQDLTSIGHIAATILYRRILGDFENFPDIRMVPVNFRERSSVKLLKKP